MNEDDIKKQAYMQACSDIADAIRLSSFGIPLPENLSVPDVVVRVRNIIHDVSESYNKRYEKKVETK